MIMVLQVLLFTLLSGLLEVLLERRRSVHAVRDAALLLGAAPIWDSGWVGVLPTFITADDVCHWPCSVGIMVKLVAFFGVLCIGQCLVLIWVLVVSSVLGSSFYMGSGLGRGLFWRMMFLAFNALGAQFQCRLFLWSRH